MAARGFETIGEVIGKSLPAIRTWGELDLNFKVVAHIDGETCTGCGICHTACEDGCDQAIRKTARPGGEAGDVYAVDLEACVGCNMCSLICPVQGCITMQEVDTGNPPMSWNRYQHLLAAGNVKRIEPPE